MFIVNALSRLPLQQPDDPIPLQLMETRFADSYAFHPIDNAMRAIYPFNFEYLQQQQTSDKHLQDRLKQLPSTFQSIQVGSSHLIHHRQTQSDPWKIVLPTILIKPALQWFHDTLHHPGATRMFNTISMHFWFPSMRHNINNFVKTCDICQKVKGPFPKLGHLPLKPTETNPWEEEQVDLVGPWTFKFNSKLSLSVLCLTAIDPFTGLCAMVRIPNKFCSTVANAFFTMWLTKFPRPLRTIHDQGTEFKGPEFTSLLKQFGIQNVSISVRNPQANSIIERMHQTLASMFRSLLLEHKQQDCTITASDLDNWITMAIASCTYAINATIHSTTKTSPGAFVFQRDMILPIQSLANWELIRRKKAAMIEKNNLRENSFRTQFNYKRGMKVLVEDTTGVKLSQKAKGPFKITELHTNGTVTIQLKPNVFHVSTSGESSHIIKK